MRLSGPSKLRIVTGPAVLVRLITALSEDGGSFLSAGRRITFDAGVSSEPEIALVVMTRHFVPLGGNASIRNTCLLATLSAPVAPSGTNLAAAPLLTLIRSRWPETLTGC